MTTKWLRDQKINIGSIPHKFDVVIIGAGPIGLMTALTLAASKKIHICVVEEKIPLLNAREIFPATLSLSKRNLTKYSKYLELQIAGLETLKRMTIEHPKITCDAILDGFFHIANTNEEMAFFEKIAIKNKNFSILMKDEARDFLKIDKDVIGGLYCPQEFIFNINKFYDRVKQVFIDSGHFMLEYTKVIDVKNMPNKILATLDNKHIIECQHLVYSTGSLPSWMPKNKNIFLKKSYNFQASLAQPFQFMPHLFNNENTAVFTNNSKINCVQLLKEAVFPSPFMLDTIYVSNIVKNLSSRLSSGGNFILENVWANNFYATIDNTPIISDIPGRPNEFLNVAFGPNGISYAPVNAAIMNDYILKTDVFKEEAKYFSLSRF